MKFSEVDLNSLVRSSAIIIVGLPLVLATGRAITDIGSVAKDGGRAALRSPSQIQNNIKSDLTGSCVSWFMSADSSKTERAAEEKIDKYFEGEVNHEQVCDWVINK